MRSFLYLLFLSVVLSSCVDKKQQANEQLILGNWVKVKIIKLPKPKDGAIWVELPPDFYTLGFTFYPNHMADNKIGYYKADRVTFLGTTSKFKITNDSIAIFGPDSNKWHTHKLITLNKDTLKFDLDGRETTFKHYTTRQYPVWKFDKIVLSTSGCFGTCPISSTMVNLDGTVVFMGQLNTAKKGILSGKIPPEKRQTLEDNFAKTNLDSLENKYIAHWTDDQTITTTFVKNGAIFKTVVDYGRRAPYLFTWAYIPMQNLYQTIPLKPIQNKEFNPYYDLIRNSYLKKGILRIDLARSELFLLFDYIRNGVVSKNSFKPRFELHTDNYLIDSAYHIKTDYDVPTDGRYYKFTLHGKPVTIDIGFNFYDVNEKIWVWRKATEND